MSRGEYEPIARAAAEKYGVPVDWFLRQITIESNWYPKAHNASGASGIAQIVPSYHPGVNVWDPVASLYYAAKYDRAMFDRYGSWPMAFAAYNWGPGRVDQWDRTIRNLPGETLRYLNGIFGSVQSWFALMTGGGPVPGPVEGEPDPTQASIGGQIGAGIVGSLTSSLRSLWTRIIGAGRDKAIETAVPIIGVGAGIGLIFVGVAAAAFKSSPAKTVTEITSAIAPDPRVRAASAGIRTLQSGAIYGRAARAARNLKEAGAPEKPTQTGKRARRVQPSAAAGVSP